MATDRHPRWLHRTAVALAIGVFPLIVVGSGVTSQNAGMAFPDWPTSNGHLVNPPNWWNGTATRWEHGHRLIGWCVGMLAIAATTMAWGRGGAVRGMALGTLGAICVQGLLGGLRVTQVSTALAAVHGVWGQLCFCMAALLAAITSRTWHTRSDREKPATSRLVFRLSLAAVAAVFLQLALGAVLRHFGGTHALISHVVWALVVSVLVAWFAILVMGLRGIPSVMTKAAFALLGLLIIQVVLGAFAYSMTAVDAFASISWSWIAPSAHVAVGALVFACTAVLAVAVRGFARVEVQEAAPRAQLSLTAS